MFVTSDCIDPQYNAQTFVVDAVRKVEGATPHTRVEAHFRPADGKPLYRVTLHLPDRTHWAGRFFQHAYPLEQPENQEDIAFALSNGAYLLNVKGVPCGCGGYRPDAAAAKLARDYARRFYGHKGPIHGYLWGGSGGGLLTVGAAENTQGVWDGIAPYVLPNAGSLLNINAAGALARLALSDKLGDISDGVAPGASHGPEVGLSGEQRAIWDEVVKLGIPPRTFESSGGDPGIGGGLLMFLSDAVKTEDPTYVEDFWTKPGYEGTNPSAWLKAALRDEWTSIREVKRDAKGQVAGLVLDRAPDLGQMGPLGPIAFEYWLYGPDGKVRLGQIVGAIAGDTIAVRGSEPVAAAPGRLGAGLDRGGAQGVSAGLDSIAPGYKVRVNNRFNLALHFYHRHAVPLERDMYTYDQFRNADGRPRFPQRIFLASSAQAVNTAGGGRQTGKIRTRVIINQSLLDGGAAPWMADWYARRVRAALGPQRSNAMFRLYYNDNAVHFDIPPQGDQGARVINYVPALYQSVLDLVNWAEQGIPPLPSTNYTVRDGQVHLATEASARHGLQPAVRLEVGGAKRIEVAAGQDVTFEARIAAPVGAGKIDATAWWFGDSAFALVPKLLAKPNATVSEKQTHRFDKPGVYYVTVWAGEHRKVGDKAPAMQIQNLDRVRVVVR